MCIRDSETGVTNVVDPLGGSWYVESLTDKLEKEAEEYFNEIDELGGVIPAIEKGYFQREIARSASEYQKKIDEGSLIHVGVNKYIKDNEELEIPTLEIGEETERIQKERMSGSFVPSEKEFFKFWGLDRKKLNNAKKNLPRNFNVKIIKVPGVFEIPVTISKHLKKFDAFIALGCVIKGQTPHFDFISQSSTNAIMDLSLIHI